jgi:hypothetical protein
VRREALLQLGDEARQIALALGEREAAGIGLVGRGPERYNLYLGAAFDGSRLGKLYADDVSAGEQPLGQPVIRMVISSSWRPCDARLSSSSVTRLGR